MSLTLLTVPCLSDNYAYLVHDSANGATAAIDVPDVSPLMEAAKTRGWTISDIWITHHHHDHIGGVDKLRAATSARVSGNAADAHRLPSLDSPLTPGAEFSFGGEIVQVLDVPGHTVGHIAFHLPGSQLVFTGDSLMGLGCGRLFEGTPEQMWASLSRLAALPNTTTVCSGHEYSQANARFARTIETGNADLKARIEVIERLRKASKPTIPTLLGLENATNPFLRAHIPAVKAAVNLSDASDAAVFAEIRRRKDSF